MAHPDLNKKEAQVKTGLSWVYFIVSSCLPSPSLCHNFRFFTTFSEGKLLIECWPSMQETLSLIQSPALHKHSVMTYTYNSNISVGAEGSKIDHSYIAVSLRPGCAT